jgi:hypothetical protein
MSYMLGWRTMCNDSAESIIDIVHCKGMRKQCDSLSQTESYEASSVI